MTRDAAATHEAFVERVREAAPERGARPLSGLRLAVKDNIAVEGYAFTAGHPLFRDRKARETASAVRRLLAAGACFVGMTRTDAGGFGVTTPGVENPLAPGFVVGGSSGGAAAALAAGEADIGLGTDTAGSVRIPAACVGCCGFKPSFGRVPLDGVWPLARSFDHLGLMARDLAVLSRAARALLGESAAASGLESPGAGRRLTFAYDACGERPCDPAIEKAMFALREGLVAAGHRIVAVALPNREEVVRAHGAVFMAEAREVHAEFSPKAIAALGEAARRALSRAPPASREELAQARAAIARITSSYDAVLAHADAVLTPTLPTAPPRLGEHKLALGGVPTSVIHAMIAETSLANVTGAPAVALPLGPSDGPIPPSVQLMGRRGEDIDLLGVAQDVRRVIERLSTGGAV